MIFKSIVRPIDKNNVKEAPEAGVNIHGLYIEGCRWNIEKGVLDESNPKILFEELPVIWLEPVIIE